MRLSLKISQLIAGFLLSLALSFPAAGQDESQPLSPVLDMVTVDPQTGFAVIRWVSSPSPDVGSYVVYTFSEGTATAIDTLRSPYVTEYTHTASAARYRSVTYVVAAIDSSLNISPLSNGLSTVWLEAAEDICTGRIIVSWTPYENQYHPATGYLLEIATGSGGNLPPVLLSPSLTGYELSGYSPETEYCFHVTAVEGETRLSSSNRHCISTGSEVPPQWVTIDAITATGTGLAVSASYDSETTMTDYIAYRFNPAGGSWQATASSAGTAGNVFFDLAGADTTIVNLYRAGALNSCGLEATVSGPVRNMVLSAVVTGTRIDLRWNRPVPNGSELFTVWRDTGGGSRQTAASLSDTIWSDDFETFASEISGAEVVYRVTAVSTSAPAGAPVHRSSAAVVETSETIHVPNAFTPGIPGENSLFRPEFAFIPQSYDFRIWSRNGALLFRTTDHSEGWDGRHSGTPLPPGVYLWSLRLTTPSGRAMNMTGTVTILP